MAKARGTSPLFILVAMITAIAALYVAKAILLPIALAILLAFLLTPLADRLERLHVPRIPAVLSVVGMSFVMLAGLGWIVTMQLVDLSRQVSDNKTALIEKIESIRPNSSAFAKVSDTLDGLKNVLLGVRPTNQEKNAAQTTQQAAADAEAQKPSSPIAAGAFNVASAAEKLLAYLATSLVAPLTTAGMVLVLLLFLLVDRENQRSRIVQLFGRSHLHTTTEAIHDVTKRVGRYLRMLFLVNSTYGVAVAAGLWFIGVPGAVTWGVLSFALRFLPYIGPWIAATIPVLVAVTTSVGWSQPLYVIGWFAVVELISNNVIEPLLYGNTVGLSTVGVVISAIFWTWLWGPIGLILAMPMTVCLVVTARYVPQLRFIMVLLGDQPPLSSAERVYQRLLAFDYAEPIKIAQKHVKESSLVSFYDDVLVPALVMAEQDRHADLLNDDQATFVVEAAEDLVAELGDAAAATHLVDTNGTQNQEAISLEAADKQMLSVRVLCIPLRDDADEATSRMLAQLLIGEGFPVLMAGAESLTGEVVDRVAATDADIVVISILPPIGPRDSRLLWKRLRSHYPNLPIIVGFWGSSEKDALEAPGQDDVDSRVATTLAQAVALVRSTAATSKIAAKTA